MVNSMTALGLISIINKQVSDKNMSDQQMRQREVSLELAWSRGFIAEENGSLIITQKGLEFLNSFCIGRYIISNPLSLPDFEKIISPIEKFEPYLPKKF